MTVSAHFENIHSFRFLFLYPLFLFLSSPQSLFGPATVRYGLYLQPIREGNVNRVYDQGQSGKAVCWAYFPQEILTPVCGFSLWPGFCCCCCCCCFPFFCLPSMWFFQLLLPLTTILDPISLFLLPNCFIPRCHKQKRKRIKRFML